jgi:hypothetical protein
LAVMIAMLPLDEFACDTEAAVPRVRLESLVINGVGVAPGVGVGLGVAVGVDVEVGLGVTTGLVVATGLGVVLAADVFVDPPEPLQAQTNCKRAMPTIRIPKRHPACKPCFGKTQACIILRPNVRPLAVHPVFYKNDAVKSISCFPLGLRAQ